MSISITEEIKAKIAELLIKQEEINVLLTSLSTPPPPPPHPSPPLPPPTSDTVDTSTWSELDKKTGKSTKKGSELKILCMTFLHRWASTNYGRPDEITSDVVEYKYYKKFILDSITENVKKNIKYKKISKEQLDQCIRTNIKEGGDIALKLKKIDKWGQTHVGQFPKIQMTDASGNGISDAELLAAINA